MKVSHRPEIDGLRAIAVTAIILYHAQITLSDHQLFKGGFIGIDLFFVISGYLITSIILKELVATGTFSFKNFYESRIRRLLPALLFVIIVSLPFAWVYLMPSSLINFAKSILYSLGFISNFYFHFSEQQIFAESALLKPFIHTWSLSLLQQFYILFPIVLFFTYKDFKKHILTILVICLILSWQIADFANKYKYSSASFSFLLTRMWELLIGSILAYFEIIKGHRSKNKILNLILPSIGLFLIGNFILLYRGTIPYTSFDTLQPIIGVCLIIWFSNKDELITKVLSTKLFVGVGLISYSLYLWHYPIYAFDRIIEFTEGSFFSELILVLIIIATSTFSYYFVERPFKNKKSKFKIITSLIIICVSTLVIVNLNFIKKNGHKNRFYISNIYQLDRQNYWSDLTRFETNFNYNNYDHRKNAIIVGNSHATDTLNILSRTNYKKKFILIEDHQKC